MRHSITLGLASIALALSGCNGGSTSENTTSTGSTGSNGSNANTQQHLVIAVIPKGSTHEYWKSVQEGAMKAQAEIPNIEIKFKGPLLENDKDSQIKVLENFMTTGVNGVVLAPLDDHALAKSVGEATKQGIPVAIIDSGLIGSDYISFIATDNEKGGQIDADELSKELGGKGKVVMLRYEVGSASTDAREKGFLEEIAKSPGIQVVSSNQYGGVTADTARTASENLLATHKKGDGLDIDGIYTPNESTTTGMLKALQGLGVAGKVKFVGFDASKPLLDALQAGQINALVIQNPRKMGYDGVKTVVDYLRGNKNVPKTEDTGATLVTKANLSQPDIAALVAPPKE